MPETCCFSDFKNTHSFFLDHT